MIMEKEKMYETPDVEVLEVKVETGFEASIPGTGAPEEI